MARAHIADQGDSEEAIPRVASKEVTSLKSARSRWSIFGWFSLISVASAASVLSIASFASVLSIGSNLSFLSIGSSMSVLSIGGHCAFLGRSWRKRRA